MTPKKRTAAKSKRPSASKRPATDKPGPVRTAKALAAKVEMQPLYGVPRRIFDIRKPTPKAARARVAPALGIRPVEAEARATAETYLKKIARTLKIAPDLSQLRFDKVVETILGTHVLFQQYEAGTPISGAWIKVDIDRGGNVYNVVNDLVPISFVRKASKAAKPQRITRAEAIQAARGSTKSPLPRIQKVEEPELVMWPVDGVPRLAWKVLLKTTRPAREYKVYVDAATGRVLKQVGLLKYAQGKGKVFNPNPVVSLGDTTLKQRSAIPPAAYLAVTLRNIDPGGTLDGPFVSTRRTANRVRSKQLKFLFTRKDRAFKEVMVYYHIDAAQRYIQSLGFANVNNRAIEVNIDGTREDNSFYSPMTRSLTFGTGGVDDAEDAEIILHEYGHSIQDNQVPGFGPSDESCAMGEGFGDYFAASFFASLKGPSLQPCVGSWDAVAYSDESPPCLRRVDGSKHYPTDIEGEEHADGEIWSACLWELRTQVGGQAADRLVIAHHFLIRATSTFREAADALITADKQLNRGKNEATIRTIFVRRGILKKAPRKKTAKHREVKAHGR